jgi:hypothetical protein
MERPRGEHRIETLGELLDLATPRNPDPRTGRLRDTGVYRGARSRSGVLYTSLDRLGGLDPAHTKCDVEAHLLRNFIRYSRPYVEGRDPDAWELLVLAQHHGLPTRLLDWSYSPLVAAHFACAAADHGDDATIWRLDWQRVHAAFDLPPLALLIEDLDAALGGGEPITPWRLFDWPEDAPAFACLLHPPSLDARIVAQSAAFTLCSDKSKSFDRFLAEHGLESALGRYVIQAEAVGRIRDQLDLAGFDERRLMPDLDGVADYLRRYYS